MDNPSGAGLTTSPRSSLDDEELKDNGLKAARKRMSQSSPGSGLSYLSAALQDRRALLLGYVKNDVVTQDRLALLWTIEAVCDDSLSRAPETHPVLLHLLQSPPMGRTTAPCLKSWPWLVPRYALVAGAPGLRVQGGYGARSHAGQCVRIPRSARPTTPTHGNKLMLPIRAGTTKRQRWWPSVTGV